MEEEIEEKKGSAFCSLLKKKEVIITLVIGLILGLLIMFLLNFFIFNKQAVISIKGKKITESQIYESMKDYYVLSFALEEADKAVLEKMYPLTDKLKASAEEKAKGYIETYVSYGYSEEEFLSGNGFDNYDEFLKAVLQNYRMELYYYEYLGKMLPEEDINNYYENNVYGDIDSKHILVKTSEDVTENEAEKLANKIISELNAGATFDEEVEKYKDQITFEELGYQKFNASLEESFMEELKALENGTYSKEPVKTSYGYHVVYRIDQAEKPSLEEVKTDIVKVLGADLEEADSNLYYKAMIQLRKDNNMKILDKELVKQYEEYCSGIEKKEE